MKPTGAGHASETLGCEPGRDVPLETATGENDVSLMADPDCEMLSMLRVFGKQGLPEVLCERLAKSVRRVKKVVKSGAHGSVSVYVSDLDEVTRASVANVGVDGKRSTRIAANKVRDGIHVPARHDGFGSR